MKLIIFPLFYEHKNSKLTQFTSISKGANFWVLQSVFYQFLDGHLRRRQSGLGIGPQQHVPLNVHTTTSKNITTCNQPATDLV